MWAYKIYQWKVPFPMLLVMVKTIYSLCREIKFPLRTNLNSSLLCKSIEIISSFKCTGFDNPILCKSLPPPTCYLCHVFHVFGIAAKPEDTCYHRFKIIIIIIHWQLKDTQCTRNKVLFSELNNDIWHVISDQMCSQRQKWNL